MRVKNANNNILNDLVEIHSTFCDKFPDEEEYIYFVCYEFNTDWYEVKIYRNRKGNWGYEWYARVINGEAFRMVDDACFYCGIHSPVGGGHLFVGREAGEGWYVNRQGWVSNKEIQVCPNCKPLHNLPETLQDPEDTGLKGLVKGFENFIRENYSRELPCGFYSTEVIMTNELSRVLNEKIQCLDDISTSLVSLYDIEILYPEWINPTGERWHWLNRVVHYSLKQGWISKDDLEEINEKLKTKVGE